MKCKHVANTKIYLQNHYLVQHFTGKVSAIDSMVKRSCIEKQHIDECVLYIDTKMRFKDYRKISSIHTKRVDAKANESISLQSVSNN